MNEIFSNYEREVARKDRVEISDEMANWLHELRMHLGNGAAILHRAAPEEQDHMISRSMDLLACLIVLPDPDAIAMAAIIANFSTSMVAAMEANDIMASTMTEAKGETKQ